MATFSGAVTMDSCANGNVQFHLNKQRHVVRRVQYESRAIYSYICCKAAQRTMNITSSSTVKVSGGAFVITAGTNTRDQLICASDGAPLYCGNINDMQAAFDNPDWRGVSCPQMAERGINGAAKARRPPQTASSKPLGRATIPAARFCCRSFEIRELFLVGMVVWQLLRKTRQHRQRN